MRKVVFVLLKPDCVKLGLTEVIKNEIKQAGLAILKTKKLTLSRVAARYIYRAILNEHFYLDLEEFMMSGECEVMLISGTDSISKIKWLKYAVREKYSPNKTVLCGKELDLWRANRHPQQRLYNVKLSAENLLHACDTEDESLQCAKFFFG